MTIISETMSHDHRRCDDLFAAAEQAADRGQWEEANRQFDAFRHATEHHFRKEEQVLFPGFEERTGMTQGPTQVMRMEHQQMRSLFAQMAEAAASKDTEGYLGLSETLLTLMQQHNIKEEQVLYPMADRALGEDGEDMVTRMQALPDTD